MERPPIALSDVRRWARSVIKASVALLAIALLSMVSLLAYAEMMTQPENIGLIECHQILDGLPKQKGETTTLASGVRVKRIDATRENEISELVDMGGVSAKWEFEEGGKGYKMFITFDNIPKAAIYTVFHPSAINHFVDIYENSKDNAWMVKEATTKGMKEIKFYLPDLPDSDFEK